MVMEGGGREAVLESYAELQHKHQEFQVACGDSCVTNSASGRHFEQSAGPGQGVLGRRVFDRRFDRKPYTHLKCTCKLQTAPYECFHG